MKKPPSSWIVPALAILAAFGLHQVGLLNLSEWRLALLRLKDFGSSLYPPRLETLPTLWVAMLETIQIAFLGTVIGFALSLPAAFLSTRTLFGPWITSAVRLVIGAVRTVPSILWGVIFVVAFGLGPAAGILGVAFYTLGYLGKLFYETFEAVDAEVLEAVRSTGCSRLQLLTHAVLPESANGVISQLLFMFEYNIRASAIMGFVGAGGIGYYMIGYVQMLQYQNLLTALLLTFGVVMAVDVASMRLRSLILPPKTA